MSHKKVTPLLCETYFAVIKNSIGTKLFQNLYARIGGRRTDIMRDGELSCAFFASSLLVLFGLIKEIHATVKGTVKDMKKSGWIQIKEPKVGSILVWEEMDSGKGDMHKHIGFYIGNRQAISNSYERGYPIKHHWTFSGKRKVETTYWHKRLR
ncbi:hypothetical protein IIA94_03080 [Patescibacteria group bacterium]|nr:hypothetical protein [Patescibacteria group bacterium]